jgi:hypothetical protein
LIKNKSSLTTTDLNTNSKPQNNLTKTVKVKNSLSLSPEGEFNKIK